MNRDLGATDLRGVEGNLRRLRERDVPRHNGDANNLNTWVLERHHQRNGVIRCGVGIDPDAPRGRHD